MASDQNFLLHRIAKLQRELSLEPVEGFHPSCFRSELTTREALSVSCLITCLQGKALRLELTHPQTPL